MIWRSSCLSSLSLHIRSAIKSFRTSPQRLYSSSLRIPRPNVAAVLANLPTNDQHIITVAGSVRTIRRQKHLAFVELGDGSTVQSLQAVLEPSQAEGLGTGTSVEITGVWRPAPPQKEQSHELKADNVRVIGASDAEVGRRLCIDLQAPLPPESSSFTLDNGYELWADKFPLQKYPIQKKYHSAEYLRSLPHLRLRTPLNALLARMRSECDFHLASFFRDQQFVRLQPPIITSSDCEGAGEVFTVSAQGSDSHIDGDKQNLDDTKVDFFKQPKYLTVSSQLHLEAFVHEHQKVWTLSPTFRAEKSDTPRHVSEFWMLEAEIRTENLQEVMDLVKDMIRDLAMRLRDSGIKEELVYANQSGKLATSESNRFTELLDQRWHGLMQSSWAYITYADAIQTLQDAVKSKQVFFRHEPSWFNGLQLEHEKYIATTVGQGGPVFVTNYPREIKPFYMLPSSFKAAGDSAEHETVACFDLVFPEVCEVVGGSLREHRLLDLTRSMGSHGLNSSSADDIDAEPGTNVSPSVETGNLDWYVDLRRYGSVPHGGFGLGFDRLLGYLAGVDNIKDVVPWPRHYGRCDC